MRQTLLPGNGPQPGRTSFPISPAKEAAERFQFLRTEKGTPSTERLMPQIQDVLNKNPELDKTDFEKQLIAKGIKKTVAKNIANLLKRVRENPEQYSKEALAKKREVKTKKFIPASHTR